MEANFEQLVVAFNLSPLSMDILQQITLLLEEITDQSLSSFVSQAYQSLLTLEHKIWQLFSQDSRHWSNHSCYSEFFQTFAAFNKNLIFKQDNITDDMKISLLIPETIDQVNHIFDQIEQTTDENDPLILFASYWFDNLSFFVHEYPQSGHLPVIIHINQYFASHFIISENFQYYLSQLRQSQSIFTAKQLFCIKTCPFSLHAYFYTNPQTFDYISDQVLQNIGHEYLQMIQIQSFVVELWSKELFACITHLIGFMRAFLWWNGQQGTKLKQLLPTEKILCEYIQAMIRIIEYKPYYKYLMAQWFNDETILMDSILVFLMNIVETQNISWFFRSMTQLPDLLLKVAETSAYYKIYLCAYGLLSEILTDEHLKEFKIIDTIRIFFFKMLEQAWHHPLKQYKQIPISYFLRGFLNVSKNDAIKEGTAKTNKISLFIEMCDQYPIVFDIIWALSFNQDIQKQLRSTTSFISKLAHLNKTCDNEQMRKTTNGILWNLEINHEDHSTSEITDGKTFDIMISYSHKEKTLCKQLYEELTKGGYRVWIDFDQMHGNVLDAMAQAIDRSHTIIICMSEHYQKSNFCRAEAQYAFQRQRKIVPIVLQQHYKPDGWLLFLIGQLLYVNFTKYEFALAINMLLKELKATDIADTNVIPVCPNDDADTMPPILSVSAPNQLPSQVFSGNILEWTQAQVHDWLIEHNLLHMSRLLTNCDGRSLVHLYKYMKHGQPQQILSLLQDDSLRRTKQSISLIELSCFHSLMDQQKQLHRSKNTTRPIETSANLEEEHF